MKAAIERRKPQGLNDYLALAIATVGVGYLPLAPGTWGSMVGVLIYLGFEWLLALIMIFEFGSDGKPTLAFWAVTTAAISVGLTMLSLVGIWASSRSTEFFGNSDPSQVVIDEVMGQLITFLFVPFTYSWTIILPGFLLFRLFDIWKPYPIDALQNLPGGLGVCADDIVAGVYAGVCLAVSHAVYLSI